MDQEQAYKEFMDHVSTLFGDQADKAKEQLAYWKEKIFKLRLAMIGGKPDEIIELKKSEKYAWTAIGNLAAEHAEQLEKNTWEIAEKALKLLRNVLLTP